MKAPPMLWRVYGHRDYRRETVAIFFDWSAAVDFVNHASRNLYIDLPRYDPRGRFPQPQKES